MDIRGLRTIIRADLAAKGARSDRLTVAVFRLGQYTHEKRRRLPLHIVYLLLNFVWVNAIVGAELPPTMKIGGGFRLAHWGRGVILHPATVMGQNCYLYHGVTIGQGNGGSPTLGNYVYVGAGAKILGNISVGTRARIGSGAVVVRDVPEYATVVGVPARVIGVRERGNDLSNGAPGVA